MSNKSQVIINCYIILTFLVTLSTSLIWGINTLFLLDAGLNNFQAFAANAFYTVGQVVFEIPTGFVADYKSRRLSFLLGAITLALATLLYFWLWHIQADLWAWAVSSMALGLGYTFFTGATEAWLVDALKYTGHKGDLEPTFAKAQVAAGVAMLAGAAGGGLIAQYSNLGMPYLIRVILLGVTFLYAYVYMIDLGFHPERGETHFKEIKTLWNSSIEHGIRNRPVRWLMLTTPFISGVAIYCFYAMQPYLLQLYGDPDAYFIAGLAASGMAFAQILGGLSVNKFRTLFKKRTSILVFIFSLGSLLLLMMGVFQNFYLVIMLLIIWVILFAISIPVNQALINSMIPSKERATILSFNNVMGSSGGVIFQPALGRAADIYSYATTYIISAFLTLIAIPFLFLVKREKVSTDNIVRD